MDLARGRSFNTPCKMLVTAAPTRAWRSVSHNLCTMQSAYNPQLDWCGASNQRLGALPGAGSGNGDPAGAAAVPFGFLGFRTFFRAALGGGPAG